MIIKLAGWTEYTHRGAVLKHVATVEQFTVTTIVGEDYTHDYTALRGELLSTPARHALKVPYSISRLYPYWLPFNTVDAIVKSFLALGETIQEARYHSIRQVSEDMAIALSSHHNGYRAYCVICTVTMHVPTPEGPEVITLSERATRGIECKHGPLSRRATRSIVAELPFESEEAKRAAMAIGEEQDIDEITASAEITARRALKASFLLLRQIKTNTVLGDIKVQLRRKLRESEKAVPGDSSELL